MQKKTIQNRNNTIQSQVGITKETLIMILLNSWRMRGTWWNENSNISSIYLSNWNGRGELGEHLQISPERWARWTPSALTWEVSSLNTFSSHLRGELGEYLQLSPERWAAWTPSASPLRSSAAASGRCRAAGAGRWRHLAPSAVAGADYCRCRSARDAGRRQNGPPRRESSPDRGTPSQRGPAPATPVNTRGRSSQRSSRCISATGPHF